MEKRGRIQVRSVYSSSVEKKKKKSKSWTPLRAGLGAGGGKLIKSEGPGCRAEKKGEKKGVSTPRLSFVTKTKETGERGGAKPTADLALTGKRGKGGRGLALSRGGGGGKTPEEERRPALSSISWEEGGGGGKESFERRRSKKRRKRGKKRLRSTAYDAQGRKEGKVERFSGGGKRSKKMRGKKTGQFSI